MKKLRTTPARRRANKKWRSHHRRHVTMLTYRSIARNFLRKYATLSDLDEAEKIIHNRRLTLEKGDSNGR